MSALTSVRLATLLSTLSLWPLAVSQSALEANEKCTEIGVAAAEIGGIALLFTNGLPVDVHDFYVQIYPANPDNHAEISSITIEVDPDPEEDGEPGEYREEEVYFIGHDTQHVIDQEGAWIEVAEAGHGGETSVHFSDNHRDPNRDPQGRLPPNTKAIPPGALVTMSIRFAEEYSWEWLEEHHDEEDDEAAPEIVRRGEMRGRPHPSDRICIRPTNEAGLPFAKVAYLPGTPEVVVTSARLPEDGDTHGISVFGDNRSNAPIRRLRALPAEAECVLYDMKAGATEQRSLQFNAATGEVSFTPAVAIGESFHLDLHYFLVGDDCKGACEDTIELRAVP